MQVKNYISFYAMKVRNTIPLVVLFVVFSCAEVPVSGRKQLSLVSNEQLISLSAAQYAEILQSTSISDHEEWSGLIKTVGDRIQVAVEQYFLEKGNPGHLEGYVWEFNLLDGDSIVNAWAMPGGKVAFYTGIMPICQDETGVAVVMGHEIAHAIANHGRERVSQQYAAQIGLGALSIALGGAGTAIPSDLIMQAAGAGTSLGILKFSREHESEADYLGLIFMAMAGYDPSEAPKFWERMASRAQGEAPAEFLSTHPSHDTRIADLNKWLPEAQQIYFANR
jgi:predicted Zn-dependent protease